VNTFKKSLIASFHFILLISGSLFSNIAYPVTFGTSFEFSMAGTFSIGEEPFTATFSGGTAQTVGTGAYYHSGRFSWHVPSGGLTTVSFETPVENVDFWFRDTVSAASSSYRIYDTGNTLIASGGGGQVFVNVLLSRSGSETLIARLEFDSAGGGDTVVDDFSYTVAEPPPEPPPPVSDFDPTNPITTTIATSTIAIELDEILTGLVSPVWATTAPSRDDHLYIVDQVGKIIQLNLTDNSSTEIFDVSSRLVPLGAFGPMSFDERGLLGLAFHPNYQSNGLLYTYTSEPINGAADYSTLGAGETADHQSVIAEWQVTEPMATSLTIDVNSRRELLRIDQPQFNHNGGNLAFGPSGNLFISLGDGGNADDEGDGHGVDGNGRDVTTILGSVLRINPLGNNSANGQYGIPTDNPLIGMTPVTEIYAYGFRNPYRYSFDMVSGELWLSDVGQNDIEEINHVNAGENYGWNYKEGSFFFEGNGSANGSVTDIDPGVPTGLVDPVAEYDHDEGIAIIGGFVYRGARISQLEGHYIFGDFGSFGADAGRLFHLNGDNTILAFDVGVDTRVPLAVLGFGQDAQGEVYVLTNTTGTPFGTTGSVYKINPPREPDEEIIRKLQELYVGILGRAADYPGLDYWRDQISSGTLSLENTRASFAHPDQSEYTEIYGGLDNTQLVTAIYENFLERAPELAGLQYWVDELDNGRVNADQMINAVINAVRDPSATSEESAIDLAVLDNKILAARYFTVQTKEFTFDMSVREAAQAAVADVTDDPETVIQAKAMIDEYVGN
jgi:glucose/arabinose dehydrogenase